MIRNAQLTDRAELTELIMSYAAKYPLRPDVGKIAKLLVEVISSAKNLALVSENESGEVRGALLAFVGDNFWAQRQFATVVFWVCDVPGEGVAMLRMFRDWVRSRRAIRVAGFAPDLDVDPRVWKAVERVGFKRRGGAYLMFNGGIHGAVQQAKERGEGAVPGDQEGLQESLPGCGEIARVQVG